jgi:hypothetical protein
MWGGPCHLDTFDPKPDAGNDYAGPLNKPIPTNVRNPIGELLPLLASRPTSTRHQETHGNNGTKRRVHGADGPPGGQWFILGWRWSRCSGGRRVSRTNPPASFHRAAERFSGGILGCAMGPSLSSDPGRFSLRWKSVCPCISEKRQQDRQFPTSSTRWSTPRHPQLATSAKWKEAYDLILGDAGKVFDLSQEKDELRERYGRTTFGQSCLMARRLVERGVPYITINYKGWDTHKQHFQTMRRKLPEMDKGMATLLQDLADHGLLDSTIVWWSGEFGRTPRVQWEPPWSGGAALWQGVLRAAAGGFKGGRVVGMDAKETREGPPGLSVRRHREHVRVARRGSRRQAAPSPGSDGSPHTLSFG